MSTKKLVDVCPTSGRGPGYVIRTINESKDLHDIEATPETRCECGTLTQQKNADGKFVCWYCSGGTPA